MRTFIADMLCIIFLLLMFVLVFKMQLHFMEAGL
jgi:hypothetical protein